MGRLQVGSEMESGSMESRENAHPQVAVGAVVFKDDRVLLVKRKNPPAQNMWAIPGGRIKYGETLQQAAAREIFEETSLRIKPGKIIYTFEVIEANKSAGPSYHYIIVDLEAEYISGEPKANDDALEARWISRDDLKTITVNEKTAGLLKEKYDFGIT